MTAGIYPPIPGTRRAIAAESGRHDMAWTAPKLEEVTCGMEINMYFPAEDDPSCSEPQEAAGRIVRPAGGPPARSPAA